MRKQIFLNQGCFRKKLLASKKKQFENHCLIANRILPKVTTLDILKKFCAVIIIQVQIEACNRVTWNYSFVYWNSCDRENYCGKVAVMKKNAIETKMYFYWLYCKKNIILIKISYKKVWNSRRANKGTTNSFFNNTRANNYNQIVIDIIQALYAIKIHG